MGDDWTAPAIEGKTVAGVHALDGERKAVPWPASWDTPRYIRIVFTDGSAVDFMGSGYEVEGVLFHEVTEA